MNEHHQLSVGVVVRVEVLLRQLVKSTRYSVPSQLLSPFKRPALVERGCDLVELMNQLLLIGVVLAVHELFNGALEYQYP